MTTRISNSKFLTVLDALPLDGIGWEAVAMHLGSSGDMTVMQRVYRATEMSGSKVRNDFGSGTIVIPKDDTLWSESLPTPLTGVNPLDREFLWQFYEDGALRHEFFGEDINEDIATDEDGPRLVSISGRTTELTLTWGVHVPAWSEVQDVMLDDSAEEGEFVLTFGPHRTKPIPHNATASQFKNAAVNGISVITAADLIVTKKIEEGQRKWHVRFVGQYIEGNAVPPGFGVHSSTAATDVSSGGVQVVALSSDASSGTFTLEFGDSEIGPLAYNVSAADFKAAFLAGTTGVTTDDITVTRTDEEGVLKWRIEYVGAFIGSDGDPEADPPVEPVEPIDNPGLTLKSSTVKNGTSQYTPSISGLASGGKAKYFPSVSDIEQVDFYASEDPRTAASVFLDCLTRCQERGILQFATPLFTATEDSFGQPWEDFDVIEVSPGETLLSLIQRFSEAYGWEFRMLTGFRLQVVQGGFGVNVSDTVRFWLGQHQQSHSLSRTSRELLTRVWAQTKDNLIVQSVGPSTVSALAREAWIDGFEGDASYAQQVANTTREERDGHVKLRTVKIPYNPDDDHRLFDDFSYCDWVAVEDDRNVMHVLKIESVTWKVGDSTPIDFEVTFLGE